MNKDLLQFVTAITVRRVAQIKARSMFNMPDEKNAKLNIYEIAGELCKDFKDVFLQESSDLAQTFADDKALSPVKIALMLGESIPLSMSYVDVKDNFPETENIKRKLLTVKAGHPAELTEKYFAFGSDIENYNVFTPVDERMLKKPPESDFSDLYEVVFGQAKAILSRMNKTNFADSIAEIAELLMPVPLADSKGQLFSLGAYLRAAIMIGCSIFTEINQQGPGVMQSDESKLWVLTKIEVKALADRLNLKGDFINSAREYKSCKAEILGALKTDDLLLDFHVIESSQQNQLYIIHNKSFVDELSRKLQPVLAHWQSQNKAVVGVAYVELNTHDLNDNTRLSQCFTDADLQAHREIVKKIAKNTKLAPLPDVDNNISKLNAPELKIKKTNKVIHTPTTGFLLIKQEQKPDLLLEKDTGLVALLFANKRYNVFWSSLTDTFDRSMKINLNLVHKDNGEVIFRQNMVRLLNYAREFFNMYYDFGMTLSISASLVTETKGTLENNVLEALQGFRDARNMHRPKIRAEKDVENPFSGFKGSALALCAIEGRSKSLIPSEDIKVFFEMLRQISSLAGYRVNHDDIVPLVEETKPEIFNSLHTITNKMKTDKGFNWRPVLYYLLSDRLSENTESGMQNHNEQAVKNLLTVLRYNRWQNIQRLLSRPSMIYLNILSKWLKILELK